MKRRFKSKKKIKINKLIYIFIVIFIFSFFSYINKLEYISSNKSYINHILNDISNKSITYMFENINNKIFNSPLNLLKSELYNIKNNKEENTEIVFEENKSPVIYIYNTHQGEKYSMKYLEEYNIVPDVLTASLMLGEKLNNLGINTLVEENNILEYMNKNNLDHSGSYIASRYFLQNTMNKYNNIKLYIDLHRDAISHDLSYIKINDKDCAKILFVIGLENPNYLNNLNVVEQLNNIINTKYPNLSRGIMKKKGYGVNGVYNQDLNSNVILIEIGGHENNIDEVNNTLELISIAIKEYLNEEAKK